MLTPEQQDFYHRWLQKADLIHGNDVANLIDKYISLFIIYNFLYNIVPVERHRREGGRREYVRDREGATSYMIGFVGAVDLNAYLEGQGMGVVVDQLIDAMPHFNVVLDKGQPKKRQDERLIAELGAANEATRMLALTKTLYYIRCNIVHGEKGLQQYQELLLVPAIALLRTIVVYLYDRLR